MARRKEIVMSKFLYPVFLSVATYLVCYATIIVEVDVDIGCNNLQHISHLVTFYSTTTTTTGCTYLCDKHTKGVSNYRKYTLSNKRCECYLAAEDGFRDSRLVAPETTDSVFYVNSKLNPHKFSTSRERPKSALYLRLKIVKGGTLWVLWNSSWWQNMKKNELNSVQCRKM